MVERQRRSLPTRDIILDYVTPGNLFGSGQRWHHNFTMTEKVKNKPLTARSLATACRSLSISDPHLKGVYDKYGTPPLWERQPGF